MEKKPIHSRNEWCAPTMSLIERAPLLSPSFVAEAPRDGRNLPDVDLDKLAASLLAGLSKIMTCER